MRFRSTALNVILHIGNAVGNAGFERGLNEPAV
jgi:hypothetical protein